MTPKTPNHPCHQCRIIQKNSPKDTTISVLVERFPEVCKFCPAHVRNRHYHPNELKEMNP